MPALPDAPEKLIINNELTPFGNYAGAIADMNVDEFDYTVLNRPPLTLIQSLAKKFLKRWQFVGVIDENYVLGAAVAHVQYLGTGFVYVFDRKEGKFTEINFKAPFALGTQFSQSPVSGISTIKKGRNYIIADNSIRGENERRLTVDCGDKLQAEFSYFEHGHGVTTTCPQAENGFHYTYKSAGLPAKGKIILGGKEYQFSENALALLDWTASTPPRQTTWNWSCAVGRDENNNPIGINFSRGLVGGKYSQNAVWLNGIPHMLDHVEFGYDENNILGKAWSLKSKDGLLSLEFTPDQERYENINLGLVASSLHQPFGNFKGTFKDGDKIVDLELFGFCEQHYAKW